MHHEQALALRDRWRLDAFGTRASPVTMTLDGRRVRVGEPPWRLESRTDGALDAPEVWFHDQTGLRCEIAYRLPADLPVLEWACTITNAAGRPSAEIGDLRSLDVVLPDATGATVETTRGPAETPWDFEPVLVDVPGEGFVARPGGGRSANEVLPFFDVSTESLGVAVGIGWTGAWEFAVRDGAGGLRLRAGLADVGVSLEPGESLRAATVAVAAHGGHGRHGQNAVRRWILANSPVANRPELPLSAATWGATPTSVHRQVIEQIEAERLPFEVYWVDAGWLGGDGIWYDYAGSWEPALSVHPHGLAPLASLARGAGLDFLLWYEPERVVPGSTVDLQADRDWLLSIPADAVIREIPDRTHPDWAPRHGRMNELAGEDRLLDLGHPGARDYLERLLVADVERYGIDIFRNDFNVDPIAFWDHRDSPGRRGMTQNRYVRGLYDLWDRLAGHVRLVDNCASGGRRLDLESLKRTVTLCRSDHIASSPVAHQCQAMGLGRWVPTAVSLAHIGLDRYALRSAYGLGLSLSWAVAFNRPESGPMPSTTDFDEIRAVLAEFLSVREYYAEDFYLLTPWSVRSDAWAAYQLHRPSDQSGIVVAFRRDDAADSTLSVRPHDLASEARYEFEASDGTIGGVSRLTLSGGDIGDDGLEIELGQRRSSSLVRYRPAR